METLQKYRQLYLHLSSADQFSHSKIFYMPHKEYSNHTTNKKWFLLRRKIREILPLIEPNQKFRHGIFDCLLHEDQTATPQWDYKLASRAFDYLEMYCRLLRTYPWKTEYHTLKTYGGFFRTYILSVVPGMQDILKIIGYQALKEDPTLLKLGSVPNMALLETVGFDCLTASIECEVRFDVICHKFNKLHLFEQELKLQKDDKIKDTSRYDLRTKDLRKKIVASKSLPRQIEGFQHKRIQNELLLRSLAKSRTYHAGQLHIYQRRRNMIFDDEFDDDDGHYEKLKFKKAASTHQLTFK